MKKKPDPKDRSIISMEKEEIEQFWDDEILITEEGVVQEFHLDDATDFYSGKLKSLEDGRIYSIDSREFIKTKLVLQKGDIDAELTNTLNVRDD